MSELPDYKPILKILYRSYNFVLDIYFYRFFVRHNTDWNISISYNRNFIKKRVSHLNEVLIPTPIPNLQLLTGAQDLLNAADAKSVQKRKLLRSIQGLEGDYLLVDLGGGTL